MNTAAAYHRQCRRCHGTKVYEGATCALCGGVGSVQYRGTQGAERIARTAARQAYAHARARAQESFDAAMAEARAALDRALEQARVAGSASPPSATAAPAASPKPAPHM
jgi:ribosomal protein L37E